MRQRDVYEICVTRYGALRCALRLDGHKAQPLPLAPCHFTSPMLPILIAAAARLFRRRHPLIHRFRRLRFQATPRRGMLPPIRFAATTLPPHDAARYRCF
jgi:hypothetical protein